MVDPTLSGSSGLFSFSQIRHLMRIEFGRAQRYGYPLSCLQVSVDRLDTLRDLYGYESKATVVDDVVQVLQEQTRNCDFLGRSTEDRLMAIMPHTNQNGSVRAAERLLEAVRKLPFDSSGRRLQVTLSIGCSHFEKENTLFFDALVQASEAALAEAMAMGGDCFRYRAPNEL